MITDVERGKLNDAAIEVFGTMYFTPVELLSQLPAKDTWHLQEVYIHTFIEFTGPHCARLHFYFPISLAENITAGFLGLEEEQLTEALLVDTMRESANMIVGNYLGRLDPDGACSLGIPRADKVTGFSLESAEHAGDLLAFMSDFGFIWTYLETC